MNTVYNLAFSGSGRFLAAGLGGKNGIRVFETATGRVAGKDEDYGDACYGLDWRGEEQLVTACLDGKLRRYEWVGAVGGELRCSQQSRAFGGQKPYSIQFSPDGSRVAVGYRDSKSVTVHSATDLTLLKTLETTTGDDDHLSSVTWLADGRLAAGGRWSKLFDNRWSLAIRVWSASALKAGKGAISEPLDLPAAGSSIFDLRPLPASAGGGLLFAAATPEWGVVRVKPGSTLKATTLGTPPIGQFNSKTFDTERFLVAPDGSAVAFEYAAGKFPATFTIPTTKLEAEGPGVRRESPLSAPRQTSQTLKITDWNASLPPALNGQRLQMGYYERSNSLAIAPDGTERWTVPAPSTCWAVNLSRDGKIAVAAYGDGTIRWHDVEHGGRELLAFFPHADRKRWVLWSPDGFFTCSEGGESLIGWHVNRGADKEAEFFPASQLYDFYYRPDIVTKVLAERRPASEIAKELGLSLNIESALQKTPQLVLKGATDAETIGTDSLQLTLEAQDTGGGLHDIAFFHNGKRIPADGPSTHGARGALPLQTLRFTVTLVNGENTLRAQAANDKQTIGTPAELKVKFHGVQATSTLHLLTVGLNRYQNPRYNLTYCAADAEATAAAFAQRAGGLFADVKTHTLRDDLATKSALAEKFAEVARTAKAQDVFIFVYAGHGVMGEKPGGQPGDNEFFLIPHDVTRMYGDPELLAAKGVSRKDLEEWCARVPARKQLMLLDTCQSGGLVDAFAMRGVAEEKAIAQLARATGTVVIASTGAEAYARESKEIGHGIFTRALLDGLEGKADGNKDGKIPVKEIEGYISDAVPELSKKLGQTPQFPTSYARGQDFPIGLVK